jgi:hypothetical protein
MNRTGLGSLHSGRFATTRWTMVQAASVGAPESKDALAELSTVCGAVGVMAPRVAQTIPQGCLDAAVT